MMQFTVLASGSSGNVSLLECRGRKILIDIGLGSRRLSQALNEVGCSWERIDAVVLSHVHGDHVQESSLKHLGRLGKTLWCHAEHDRWLAAQSPAWPDLRRQELLRFYDHAADVPLASGLSLRAFPVCHDAGATFGFRFEDVDFLGTERVLAYASDLGCWEHQILEALVDSDILALEFNHDVDLELSSGRPERLIARVLGDRGHLSNEQAAGLLEEVLRRSQPGRPRHLVQLHLSRHCNHPDLARAAAQKVLHKLGVHVHIHTARQHRPGPTLSLHGGSQARGRTRQLLSCVEQPLFPGWDD